MARAGQGPDNHGPQVDTLLVHELACQNPNRPSIVDRLFDQLKASLGVLWGRRHWCCAQRGQGLGNVIHLPLQRRAAPAALAAWHEIAATHGGSVTLARCGAASTGVPPAAADTVLGAWTLRTGGLPRPMRLHAQQPRALQPGGVVGSPVPGALGARLRRGDMTPCSPAGGGRRCDPADPGRGCGLPGS